MNDLNSDSPALELRDLRVRYGTKDVLRGVSLAVAPGSVYALLGRNGAGKSSLLRCLLGQQRPLQGEARLLGHDAWSRRSAALARIGVIPEEPDAPPHLSPADLARFCGALYREWRQDAVAARLRRFGVPLETPFGALSKGQKGHTMLALALGHQPDVLVLDDPTLGLDAVARRAVFDELIGELSERGSTVLLASHDLAGVARIAERVGVLHDGRLVVDEDLDALRARFRRVRGPAALGAEALAGLEPLPLRERPWGREAVVARFDPARFAALAARGDVTADPMPLEEIFLALVGEEGA